MSVPVGIAWRIIPVHHPLPKFFFSQVSPLFHRLPKIKNKHDTRRIHQQNHTQEANMNDMLTKLQNLERQMAADKGAFSLFGLFLQEDRQHWDLLVAAPWIDQDEGKALRYIATQVQALGSEELTPLSHIQVIKANHPELATLHHTVQVHHGCVEVNNNTFFGLQIHQAHIITSQSPSRTKHKKKAPGKKKYTKLNIRWHTH